MPPATSATTQQSITPLTAIAAQFGLPDDVTAESTTSTSTGQPTPSSAPDDNSQPRRPIDLNAIVLCSLAPAHGSSSANRRHGALSTSRQHHTGALHINAAAAASTSDVVSSLPTEEDSAASSTIPLNIPVTPSPYTFSNRELNPVDRGVVVPVVATLVLPLSDTCRYQEAAASGGISKGKSSSNKQQQQRSGLYIHSIRNHVLEKRPSFQQQRQQCLSAQAQVFEAAMNATFMSRNTDGFLSLESLSAWSNASASKQYQRSADALDRTRKKIKASIKAGNLADTTRLRSLYIHESIGQEQDSTYFELICFIPLSELINVETEEDRVDRLYRVLNYDSFDSCLNSKLFAQKKDAANGQQQLPFDLGAGILPRLRHMLDKHIIKSTTDDEKQQQQQSTVLPSPRHIHTSPSSYPTRSEGGPPSCCSCVLQNNHTWFVNSFDTVPHTTTATTTSTVFANNHQPQLPSSVSALKNGGGHDVTTTTSLPKTTCLCRCRFCLQYNTPATTTPSPPILSRPIFSENNWEEWWAMFAPGHARSILCRSTAGSSGGGGGEQATTTSDGVNNNSMGSICSPSYQMNASFASNVTAVELSPYAGHNNITTTTTPILHRSTDETTTTTTTANNHNSSSSASVSSVVSNNNYNSSLLVCKNAIAFPPLQVISKSGGSASSSLSSASYTRVFIHFNDKKATADETADVQQLILFVPETSSLLLANSSNNTEDATTSTATFPERSPLRGLDFVSTLVTAIYSCPQFMPSSLSPLISGGEATTTSNTNNSPPLTPFEMARLVERRVTAFVSPKSGMGGAVKVWQQVMFPILRVSRFRCRAVLTERVKHAEDLVAGSAFTPVFPASSDGEEATTVDDEESRLFPLLFPQSALTVAASSISDDNEVKEEVAGARGGEGLGANDVLVAVGGDGMIFEIFNGIARRFNYASIPAVSKTNTTNTTTIATINNNNIPSSSSGSTENESDADALARGAWHGLPRDDANIQYILPPSILNRIPTVGVIAAGSGCAIATVLDVLSVSRGTLAIVHNRVAVTSLLRLDPTDIPTSALYSGTASRHGITRTKADDKDSASRNLLKGSDRVDASSSHGVRFACMSVSFAVTNEVDQGSESWRWMGNARFTAKVGQLLLSSVPDYLTHIKYSKFNPALHANTSSTSPNHLLQLEEENKENKHQKSSSSLPSSSSTSQPEAGWTNITPKRLIFCMVLSMTHISRDVVMAPDANPNDGCLELCVMDTRKPGSLPTPEAAKKIRAARIRVKEELLNNVAVSVADGVERRKEEGGDSMAAAAAAAFLSEDDDEHHHHGVEEEKEVAGKAASTKEKKKNKKTAPISRGDLINFFVETDEGRHVHNPLVQYVKANRIHVVPVDGTVMADGEVMPKTGMMISQVINAIKYIKGDGCGW